MQLAKSDANIMTKNNMASLEEAPAAEPIAEKNVEWFINLKLSKTLTDDDTDTSQ